MTPALLALMQYHAPQAQAQAQPRLTQSALQQIQGNLYGAPQAQARPQIAPAALAAIQGMFARPGSSAGFSPALAAALNPSISGSALAESARGEDTVYGFDSGANIAALATATLTVAPQKRHTPKRVSITALTASQFAMSDFRVGVEPILATVGNINMAIFIQDSTAPSFRAVICEVGMDVSITVTNITAATPARFLATVVGTYLPTLR